MAQEDQVVESTPAEPAGLDMDAAVADIAESLRMVETPAEAEAPNEAAPTEPKEAAPTGGEKPAGEKVAEPAAPAVDATDKAPDTWTKTGKENWGKLPAEIKAEIRKRESDIARFVGETKPSADVGKAFEKLLSPFMDQYTKNGVDPWKLTADLHAAHNTLILGRPEQKVALLKNIAQGIGVDLAKLAAGDEAGAAAPTAEREYIGRLEARLNQLEQGVSGVTSTVQAARAAELEQSVLAFAQDEAAHPHFWDVVDDMNHLITTRAAANLEDAYKIAIHANPLTREKLFNAEAEKRAAALAEAAKTKAVGARKAASANVRSSLTGRFASPATSIDDTLKEALAGIHSRESH